MRNSRGWGLLLPLTGFLRARASAGPRARFASRRKYGLQGVRQFGRAHTQLRNPVPHQPAQQFLSPRSHEHVHLAAVFRGAFAAEKPPLLHAVHQFHGAVVLDLQPLGQAAMVGSSSEGSPRNASMPTYDRLIWYSISYADMIAVTKVA
jgi:hypothetical protein